jgi:hypothetical protein
MICCYFLISVPEIENSLVLFDKFWNKLVLLLSNFFKRYVANSSKDGDAKLLAYRLTRMAAGPPNAYEPEEKPNLPVVPAMP